MIEAIKNRVVLRTDELDEFFRTIKVEVKTEDCCSDDLVGLCIGAYYVAGLAIPDGWAFCCEECPLEVWNGEDVCPILEKLL